MPLPGGAEAVYNSSGQYYRHADWLGTSRLATTSSRTLYYSAAYAPFGENYAPLGTQDLSFIGQNQDTESSGAGGAGGLYDFLYREHSPVQGRWLSPDPSGLAAVNPADPQSWNRYAYVGNRPLKSVDSLGLDGPWCDPEDPDCDYCDPDDPDCGYCAPDDPLCWWDPPLPILPPGIHIPITPLAPDGGLTELPTGLNTPPLGLDNLLGLLPGLACGSVSGSGFTSGGQSIEASICVLPLPLIEVALGYGDQPPSQPASIIGGTASAVCTNPVSEKKFKLFTLCAYICTVFNDPLNLLGKTYFIDPLVFINKVCGAFYRKCPSIVEFTYPQGASISFVTSAKCTQ